jgi:hypothetical protein
MISPSSVFLKLTAPAIPALGSRMNLCRRQWERGEKIEDGLERDFMKTGDRSSRLCFGEVFPFRVRLC